MGASNISLPQIRLLQTKKTTLFLYCFVAIGIKIRQTTPLACIFGAFYLQKQEERYIIDLIICSIKNPTKNIV